MISLHYIILLQSGINNNSMVRVSNQNSVLMLQVQFAFNGAQKFSEFAKNLSSKVNITYSYCMFNSNFLLLNLLLMQDQKTDPVTFC